MGGENGKVTKFMDCGDIVYHYTSLDALFNIIRNGNLTFRASRFDCMNDPNEYKFGRRMLERLIVEEKVDRSNFDPNSKDYIPYVVSYSPLKDAPVMWRLYRANVAIAVKKDSIKRLFPDWLYGDCKYANEENFLEVFKSVTNDIETMCVDDQGYAEQYDNILTLIKHCDYKIEPEFRVYDRQREEFTMDRNGIKDIDSDFVNEYRATGLDVKYYKDMILPREALAGIIIHSFDSEEFKKVKDRITFALAENGFDTTRICILRTSNAEVKY